MGPISRRMLASLVDDNPTGEKGFRPHEVSAAAVRHGWAVWRGDLGRIKWYEITDAGRTALATWRDHHPGREP